MTDFQGADLSTVIDTEARPAEGGGGAVPPVIEEPKAPRSVRDDLEQVFKDDAKKAEAKPDPAKDAKEPEKPAEKPAEGDDKPAPTDDAAKVEKAPEKAPEAKEEQPQREGRRIDPPAKFLPDAKEKWRNTPQAVQRDIETLVRDTEAQITRHREASERYEPVRQYDEFLRSQGRDVKTVLDRVTEIESTLAQNPIAGLNAILLEAGPRKADGSPVTLMDIVQHVSQQVQQNGPQAYQQMVAQPQRQAQQQGPNPEVEALKQKIEAMEQQQLAAAVIEPFKAANPRFEELQDDIAFFLQSGKIPDSLSPQERLSAAYDMAVRINPASHGGPEPLGSPAEPRRADDAFSGSKSIKSAPGSVSEEVEAEAKTGESRRDSLLKEMRRLNR